MTKSAPELQSKARPLLRGTPTILGHDTHLFGVINDEAFDLRGGGEGRPYDGALFTNLASDRPVSFPMHILSPIAIMGYPTFSNYQKGGYDLFKISDGYQYTRHLRFDCGGEMITRHDIVRHEKKVTGEFEVLEAKLDAPPIVDIEPSVETFMPAGPGRIESFFKVRWVAEDGGRYSADVNSTYYLNHRLTLPFSHFRLVKFRCDHTPTRLKQDETLIVVHDFDQLSV